MHSPKVCAPKLYIYSVFLSGICSYQCQPQTLRPRPTELLPVHITEGLSLIHTLYVLSPHCVNKPRVPFQNYTHVSPPHLHTCFLLSLYPLWPQQHLSPCIVINCLCIFFLSLDDTGRRSTTSISGFLFISFSFACPNMLTVVPQEFSTGLLHRGRGICETEVGNSWIVQWNSKLCSVGTVVNNTVLYFWKLLLE